MRGNSLFRALRVDKLTYAALEATLLGYVKRDYDQIPALKMMHMSKTEISRRAANVISTVDDGLHAELIDGESLIGGGSAPSATLPTTLIALSSRTMAADVLSSRLRSANPPVVARVEDGRVLLDLRTVFPEQDELVRTVIAQIAAT